MRAWAVATSVVAMMGCSGPTATDAGGLDGGSDAPSLDARDAPVLDAADALAFDARPDARVAVDVGSDAPSIDTGVDANDVAADTGSDTPAPVDAGADAPTGSGTIVTCAPLVPPGASAGLSCDATFWPGFQFDVTTDSHLIGVGVQGSVGGSAPASVHVSVVRVASAGAAPMIDEPGAIAAQALLTLATGAPAVGTVSMDAILTPGRYALVVGTGAFGATATSASIPSSGGSGCTLSGGFPYTLRRTDGAYIAQGASPHLFVVFE